LVARYGGEEFVVLLPGKTAADAARIAVALQKAILAGTADLPDTANLSGSSHACAPAAPTVSVGVAEWLAPEANLEPALSRADAGLYRAKSSGRNQVG
jgi:diguanylate cyclase (GGDEF)-like protein